MHLPAKQRYATFAAGLVMLGGVSYAGMKSLRPDEPLSVAPISGTAHPISDPSSRPSETRQIDAVSPKPIGTPTEEPKPEPPKDVVVAMAGAVKTPGLLHLPPDARVDDAVKAAGGSKPDADLEAINLAAKAVDGDQIYVPHKKAEEPAKAAETAKVSERYRGGEVSPHYAPLAVPMPSALGGKISVVAEGHTHGGAKAKATGPVSLNTASEAQLETLPGVGPSTAQKILDYRHEHGGFGSIEEITAVKGIGPKKFEKMRAFLKR